MSEPPQAPPPPPPSAPPPPPSSSSPPPSTPPPSEDPWGASEDWQSTQRVTATAIESTPPTNGPAIAALVFGLIALLLSWIPIINVVALVAGIIALICGIAGIRRSRTPGMGQKGVAVGGIVTGLLGAALSLLILGALLVGFGAVFNQPEFREAFERMRQGEDPQAVLEDFQEEFEAPLHDAQMLPGSYNVQGHELTDVQVGRDFADDFEVRALVTNTGPPIQHAEFLVSILSGETVVGTGEATAGALGTGDSTPITFISFDDYVEWDSVRFELVSQS